MGDGFIITEYLTDTVKKGVTVYEANKMVYNEKGNTLHVRFSDKKGVFCKEIVYSIAEDCSVIGFEILNYLTKGERKPSKVLPVKTQILKAS